MDLRALLLYHLLYLTVTVSCTSAETAYFHENSVVTITPSQNLSADAYFGYSITYVPSNKRLIVGAPNADDVGKIFQCVIKTATCTEVESNLYKSVRGQEVKTVRFWNGASLAAGQSFFVGCAPRVVKNHKEPNLWLTTGQCHVYSDKNNFVPIEVHKVKPYDLTLNRTRLKDVADSFGWSISIADDESLMIGGPAIASGRVAIYRPYKDQNTKSPSHQPSWTNFPILDLGAYRKVKFHFGYSVMLRNTSEDKHEYVATSPYGSVGKGRMVIRDDISNKRTTKYGRSLITNSDNLGALYGAAICLMRQGKAEYLLVGSPAYTKKKSKKIDLGKVDVYSNYNRKNKRRHSTIYGSKAGGYFGHAIVNLGDVNDDHIDDIAIAAPYEDDYLGAIYIFSGASLLDESNTWLQRIQPEGYRFLGVSMVSMQNYDDNGCSALAIGAPGNNKALVFHCMASVNVEVIVSPRNIELNASSPVSSIQLHNNNTIHFTFYSCVNVKYPVKLKNIKLEMQFEVTMRHPEEDILAPRKYNASLTESKTVYCTAVSPNLKKNINYMNPLEITIKAEQLNNPSQRAYFHPSLVILSDTSVLTRQENLYVVDFTSKHPSELKLYVTTSLREGYIIGSSNEEHISISVKNPGYTAYKANVVVQVEGVRVKRAPDCGRLVYDGDWNCPSKGPLWTGDVWKINEIYLEMNTLTSLNKFIDIKIFLSDAYEDNNKIDTKELHYSLITDKQGVLVEGSSNYDKALNITKSSQKRVEHTYLITNKGVTNWNNLDFTLQLPINDCIVNSSDVMDLVLVNEGTTCILNENLNKREVDCQISSLKSNQTVKIVALININGVTTESANCTFSTNFTMIIEDKVISRSVSNNVNFLTIPTYVIIFAVVFSLAILAVIVAILYKIGFLKRKNKEKLVNLQREVRRKSMMRQSLVASTEGENASTDEILKEIEFIGEITDPKY